MLAHFKLVVSMSGKGNCYDNAASPNPEATVIICQY
jgi:hypothetical protein